MTTKTVTDQERQIVQMMILDRWNPGRINEKIANHFGLTKNQVRHIRRKPQFKAEYAKQVAIYQGAFDDIQMADRKERVKALDQLYDKIPDRRVSLKVKVLSAIRAEVGDDKRIEHTHRLEPTPESCQGPRIPPRAETYREWLQQNEKTAEAEGIEIIPEQDGPGQEEDGQKEIDTDPLHWLGIDNEKDAADGDGD